MEKRGPFLKRQRIELKEGSLAHARRIPRWGNEGMKCIGLLAVAVGLLAAQSQPVLKKRAGHQAPLRDRIRHTTWHPGCPVAPEDLRQLTLTYLDFNGKQRTGILLVNKDLADEVVRIFQSLFQHGFSIEHTWRRSKDYGGDDDASMAANNTSAFNNCRDATGKPGVFSNHSWGRAIDINPLTNPYVKGDKACFRPPAAGISIEPGRSRVLILKDSFIVQVFEKTGWTWGGRWPDRQDYQHFEKP